MTAHLFLSRNRDRLLWSLGNGALGRRLLSLNWSDRET
jgi:hypothetical protein